MAGADSASVSLRSQRELRVRDDIAATPSPATSSRRARAQVCVVKNIPMEMVVAGADSASGSSKFST